MDPPSLARQGLYAIADFDSCHRRGLEPVEVARAMLAAGCPLVQLRAKKVADEKYLRWLSLCSESAVPGQLVVNDRVDLALLARVDVVHVGQDDLPPQEVRRLSPTLSVGLSTHDLLQVRAACEGGVDYVAFGPVFATASKNNPEPTTGSEALRAAAALCKAKHIPLVAIGGITDATLLSVAPHCDMVAAIGWLLPAEGDRTPYRSIEAKCRAIHERILSLRFG